MLWLYCALLWLCYAVLCCGYLVYQHTSNENLFKLQVLQNNACRIILRDGDIVHVFDMHASLSLHLLVERRLFHAAVFMYKVCNNLILSRKITDLFIPVNLIHDVNTRSHARRDLHVLETRTHFGERSIQVFGPRTWNLLPLDMRSSSSLNIFIGHYWRLLHILN